MRKIILVELVAVKKVGNMTRQTHVPASKLQKCYGDSSGVRMLPCMCGCHVCVKTRSGLAECTLPEARDPASLGYTTEKMSPTKGDFKDQCKCSLTSKTCGTHICTFMNTHAVG